MQSLSPYVCPTTNNTLQHKHHWTQITGTKGTLTHFMLLNTQLQHGGLQVHGAVALEDGVQIGRASSADVCVSDSGVAASVSEDHARVRIEDRIHYIQDCEGSHGTWLNGKQLTPGKKVRLHPGDLISFGAARGDGCMYKVKQMHVSQRGEGLLACNNDGSPRRYEVSWREHRAKADPPAPTGRVVA